MVYNKAHGYKPKYFRFSGICEAKNLLAENMAHARQIGTTINLTKMKEIKAVIIDATAIGNRQ